MAIKWPCPFEVAVRKIARCDNFFHSLLGGANARFESSCFCCIDVYYDRLLTLLINDIGIFHTTVVDFSSNIYSTLFHTDHDDCERLCVFLRVHRYLPLVD